MLPFTSQPEALPYPQRHYPNEMNSSAGLLLFGPRRCVSREPAVSVFRVKQFTVICETCNLNSDLHVSQAVHLYAVQI
jgi:hypothetical protein